MCKVGFCTSTEQTDLSEHLLPVSDNTNYCYEPAQRRKRSTFLHRHTVPYLQKVLAGLDLHLGCEDCCCSCMLFSFIWGLPHYFFQPKSLFLYFFSYLARFSTYIKIHKWIFAVSGTIWLEKGLFIKIKNVGKYKLGWKRHIVASCRGTRCRRGRKKITWAASIPFMLISLWAIT